MTIEEKPLHPLFAAELRGVDLRRPVPPAVFRTIEAAFDRCAVLVFPGQKLSDEQQVAFSQLFGPLEASVDYAGEQRNTRHEITDISNVDPQGRLFSAEDRRRLFSLGNQLWHTDSSFKHVPAKCSLLSAREIPPEGGETEFADLRAAWDALPDSRRRGLEGLIVEHSIFRSRQLIGFTDFKDEIFAKLPPVQQLLVRNHPGSHRRTLYLASHASHVVGWPVDKGRALLAELIEFATQERFVYRHRWRVGDLVIWDNRCTMHRGRPYDDIRHRRIMHRTTVADVANTIEQERRAAGASAA
jgi:alpha-ketoglutarate-dependent 2,4-dichlorophenoxyacetate dioxygenase